MARRRPSARKTTKGGDGEDGQELQPTQQQQPQTQQQQQPQAQTRQDSSSQSCNPTALDCGISVVVASNLPAVMQLLSNDPLLATYNFEMRSTKCLNTAVMMMYLMLGQSAIEVAGRCSSSDVRARRKTFARDNASKMPVISTDKLIAERLIEFLFRKERKVSSELNYILMTHSDMKFPKPNVGTERSGDLETFPGHVFVIERIVSHEGALSFNVYQSYLNHYDFAMHMQGKHEASQQQVNQAAQQEVRQVNRAAQQEEMHKQNLTASVDGPTLREHLYIIAKGFERDTWTSEDTKNWEAFTHSKNAKRFEGRDRSGIHICHQIVPVERCSGQLETLCKDALSKINANLDRSKSDESRGRYLSTTWGDPKKSNTSNDGNEMVSKSLTNEGMKAALEKILKELSTKCKDPNPEPKWFANDQNASIETTQQAQAQRQNPSQQNASQQNASQQNASQQAASNASKASNPTQAQRSTVQAQSLQEGHRPDQASTPTPKPTPLANGGARTPRARRAARKVVKKGGKADTAQLLRVEDASSIDRASDFLSKTPNNSFLLVHSTYCGHCHSMRNDFEKAAEKIVENGINVVDVNSNSLREASGGNAILKAVESSQLTGYPHMVQLGEGGKFMKVYNGDRSTRDMVSFATGR